MNDEITVWIEQLKGSDPQAIERIWKSYFDRLTGLARKRLGSRDGRVSDEEDIALSALNSFYNGVRASRFPQLNDRGDLWRILVTIGLRKVTAHRRRQFADKRGRGRVFDEAALEGQENGSFGGLQNVPAGQPTPEEEVAVAETLDAMLAALDDDLLRETATKRLEGWTNDEIAAQMDCTTRTVERRLEKIRGIWSLAPKE